MNTNWNYYKIFYHVYKCGTTSAAANELHIAQPAVSHDIKQLENTLGCKLFERSSYGMTPTSMGKLLYDHIAEAVGSIESAEAILEAEVSSSDKIINIGASDITMQHFLYPHLESFKIQHPEIESNITLCKNLDEILGLFRENKIDFSVLHDAPLGNQDYKSVPVKTIHDAVFCSANSAKQVKEECLSPADLLKYPMVLHEKGCVGRKVVDDYMTSNGMELIKPIYEYAINSSIIYQVNRSFALGIVFEGRIEEDVELGKFIKLQIEPPLPPRHFWLICPTRSRRKYANKMIDYILSTLPKEKNHKQKQDSPNL